MKWNLALVALLSQVVVSLPSGPADACGVRINVTQKAPRRVVPHTSRPSHVLLVGTPPRSLERDLSTAGHDVETATTADAASRESYAIVIVDSTDQVTAARRRFTDATVIVRSGDNRTDLRSVEDRVARHLVRADDKGPVLSQREPRQPLATGPVRGPAPALLDVKHPDAAPPVGLPMPPPAPPARAPEQLTTARPPVEAPPTPRQVTSRPELGSELHQELYFSLGSAAIGNQGRLRVAVRWLTTHADAHVVVEGYADPTGSPDTNMALSQTRAESVRDYLAAHGVDGARIDVVPYGDTRLKYGRTDARNRRVAIEATK